MVQSSGFDFGDNSIAGAYADVLVPILFEPWAQSLLEEYGPWEGRSVLDLACGTGIVANLLAKKVESSGSVIGMDMNREMLDIAAAQSESQPNLKFVTCSAERLDCPDSSFDYVICQQGFQFFSDRNAAANEIHRVLRGDGTAIASVWKPVSECQFFGTICDALAAIDEHEIADMMRVPFDFMPRNELVEAFESAGFSTVGVSRKEKNLLMSGGIQQAIQAAYSTPIGPSLRALASDTQAEFVEALTSRAMQLDGDSVTMGKMVSDVLVAAR